MKTILRALLLLGALLHAVPAAAQVPPLRTIMVNGTPVTVPRPVLNFTGAGVTYTDDAINKRMVLTISGSGAGGGSTSQNYALLGPTSGSGTATFRALTLGDMPLTVKARPYFDIRDYGAVAGSDIAAAVQAAFNAACAAGGGDVVVPSRDQNSALVVWRWQSAVTVNCQPSGIGPPTQLGLIGPGAILVSAQPGSPYTVLTVQQVLNTRDLRWYGTMDTAHPSTGMNPISALIRSGSGINSQDNQYNGLKLDRPVGSFSLQPENGVLVSGSIRSTRDQFGGIAGSNQAVIRAADWTELVVRDFWIRDFYLLDGVTMSPTDGGEYPYASIVAIRPFTGSEQHHFAAQSVIIENGRIDEGSGGLGEQIVVWRGFGETTEKAQFVSIRNVSSMVPPTSGSAAIRLDGVHKASIEDWFVFAGSGGGRALYADVVDELTIRRTFTCTACNPAWPANDKVLITSGVGLVRAEDSHLNLSTNNSALQTIIEKPGTPRNLLSYASGSRPSAGSVRTGASLWNSTSSRPNFSDGAKWTDALGGIERYRYSFVDHLEKAVNRGLDVTAALASGSLTVGQAFFFCAPATVTGARFYLPTSYSSTFRVTLWKDSTRIESKDVPVSAAGKYTVSFNSTYPITGDDLYRRLAVTIWDTGGSPKYVSFNPLTSPYSFQSYGGIPVLAGDAYIIEGQFYYGSGDVAPSVVSNSGYAGVEPTFTIDP